MQPNLTGSSISQTSAYGLLAVLAFGLMSNATAVVTTSYLWRTKWYEEIQNKMGTVGAVLAGPWVQGLGWMSYTILVAVSTFLFIERFQPGVPSNPAGDFNWVYGWLVAALFMGYVIPIFVAKVTNFMWISIMMLILLTTLVIPFAYMLRFTTNGSGHLSQGDPAIWCLLFPVIWILIELCVTIAIYAYDDIPGGKDQVSDRLVRYVHPANSNSADEAILRATLKSDPNPDVSGKNIQTGLGVFGKTAGLGSQFSNVVSSAAGASLSQGSNTASQQHNYSSYSGNSEFLSRTTEGKHKKSEMY